MVEVVPSAVVEVGAQVVEVVEVGVMGAARAVWVTGMVQAAAAAAAEIWVPILVALVASMRLGETLTLLLLLVLLQVLPTAASTWPTTMIVCRC